MKYSTILLALAATVYAQSIDELVADIPACAVDCLAKAATENGCGVADYDCQCGEKYEKLFTVAQPCVREACETGELTGVISGVDAVCKYVEANPGKGGGDQSAAPSDETSADAAQTTASETSAEATTAETSAKATTTSADDSTSTGSDDKTSGASTSDAAKTSADAPAETGAAANIKVAGGLLGAGLAIAAIM